MHINFFGITDLYGLIQIYTDLDGFIFEYWVPINPYYGSQSNQYIRNKSV